MTSPAREGELASRAAFVEATAAADVWFRGREDFVDGVESCVSENVDFYKAGPDRSRALLNSVV